MDGQKDDLRRDEMRLLLDELIAENEQTDLPAPEVRRNIRRSLALTQSQVARLLEVSRSAVGRWERSGPAGREPSGVKRRQYKDLLDEMIARVR